VSGSEIAAAQQRRVRTGQFVISKIDARNGAFGLVPAELDGAVVSTDFPVFDINQEVAEPRFVEWLSKTPNFVDLCRRASEGSTNRVRLTEGRFFNLKVSIPGLPQQRRILARLDKVEQLVDELRAEKARAVAEVHALVSSLHFAFSPMNERDMAEYLALDEDRVPIEASVSYPQVGVRGFAGGLFRKEALTGSETSYKHFNRLRNGLFLVSQPKGWEGAVAVCGPEFEGWFASPEYRTFCCIPGKLHPDYLAALLATPWFQGGLAKLTRGQGARRERLRPEMLLAMRTRMPSWNKQLEVTRIIKDTKAVASSETIFATNVDAILPAMLHEIFGETEV
jgi:type I restriction enzyme S subunit